MKKLTLKTSKILSTLISLSLFGNITLAEPSMHLSVDLENVALLEDKVLNNQSDILNKSESYNALAFCEALQIRSQEENAIKENKGVKVQKNDVKKETKGFNSYQKPEDIKDYQKAVELVGNKNTTELIENLKLTSKHQFLSLDLISFLGDKDFKDNQIHIDFVACALLKKHQDVDQQKLIKESYNRMFVTPKIESGLNLIDWIKMIDLDSFYHSYTNMKNLKSGYSFELLDAYVDYLNKNLNNYFKAKTQEEKGMVFDEKMTKRILTKTIKAVYNDEIDYEILFRKEKRIE